MASAAALERRLWATVLYTSSELPIAPGCESLLRRLVSDTVSRLKEDGRLRSAAHVRLAEASMSHFVAAMVLEAKKAGVTQLQENFFDKVKRKLCPIYPIC